MGRQAEFGEGQSVTPLVTGPLRFFVHCVCFCFSVVAAVPG